MSDPSPEQIAAKLQAGAELIRQAGVKPPTVYDDTEWRFMKEHPAVFECASIMEQAAALLRLPRVESPEDKHDPKIAVGEAGARLRALVAQLEKTGYECSDRGQGQGYLHSSRLLAAELDALLSAPVVSPPPHEPVRTACDDCLAERRKLQVEIAALQAEVAILRSESPCEPPKPFIVSERWENVNVGHGVLYGKCPRCGCARIGEYCPPPCNTVSARWARGQRVCVPERLAEASAPVVTQEGE